jgi:predicted nucleotidyltransferase component of viral defense system
MIDFLQQQIADDSSNEAKINRLRETLQLVCLKILHDKGYFSKMAFVGGTALRIIYDMRRFSEDMDFSVIDKKGYDFSATIDELKREFALRGLELEAKTRIEKTVQAGMLKFPGLLKELSLSELAGQKLSIKLEVDSNPPGGAQVESTVVNKIYVLNITHLALPSLYATKLHACFFRKYTKGRDFYDLIWYLGKKVKPNYALLNNAIKQTQGKDVGLDEGNIMAYLLERLEQIDFGAVKKDVERFLEDKGELALLQKTIIAKSIMDVFGGGK